MADFHIEDAQRHQLLEDGYVSLPDALPRTLLSRWQELASSLEEQALAAHARGDSQHGACVVEDPVGPRLTRQDDILGVDPDAVLDLLACPAMLAVAREFSGRGTVPLQLDILYKHQHPHPVILWHQGATHPRGYPYLNVGIYLDDAGAGDGCLRYVPGSQHELHDIATLSSTHGWEIPGVVEQPAAAGDVLVQDMMVLHGSAPKRTPGVRRTIYVELRPVAGIVESGAQSEFWAELRSRWMAMVVRRGGDKAWPDAWRADLPGGLSSDEVEAAAIVEHWEPPIPAVYGLQGEPRADYPVPADLREVS